jgi:hypothetical protein
MRLNLITETAIWTYVASASKHIGSLTSRRYNIEIQSESKQIFRGPSVMGAKTREESKDESKQS